MHAGDHPGRDEIIGAAGCALAATGKGSGRPARFLLRRARKTLSGRSFFLWLSGTGGLFLLSPTAGWRTRIPEITAFVHGEDNIAESRMGGNQKGAVKKVTASFSCNKKCLYPLKIKGLEALLWYNVLA